MYALNFLMLYTHMLVRFMMIPFLCKDVSVTNLRGKDHLGLFHYMVYTDRMSFPIVKIVQH